VAFPPFHIVTKRAGDAPRQCRRRRRRRRRVSIPPRSRKILERPACPRCRPRAVATALLADLRRDPAAAAKAHAHRVGLGNLKRLPTVHDGGLAKAERMAHLVANRYTEQIDVDTFAREVDLHLNHAMRLFHLVFGTSLASYITQYRIFQAQRLLVISDLSVVDISEAAGFGSLSRFNRAFREQCACSPRDYRKRHALGVEAPPAK